jgi:O-antigen/teichoic acid export membrane protein
MVSGGRAIAAAGAGEGAGLEAGRLRTGMVRAALWLIGSNLSSQALRLGSNLVLTRLLVPDAFGIVAAVNTLYFGLVMFSDLGVWQSVVKSERGTDARFLGTAWSVQLLRGAVLALVVCAIAAAVQLAALQGYFAPGTAYADPRMPWVIAAFAACALVQGAESMKLATAQRALLGRELARLELLSQLAALAVTLALAVWTRSVWALVAGTLVSAVVRAVLSHLALPGEPVRPCWHSASACEIVGFGKWVFASSIVGFLAAHGEKLILAGSLSSTSFGVFSIAALLVAAAAGVYSSLNGHVVFSSLSLAQRAGRAELERVYARTQRVADLGLGLLAGTLAGVGPWIVAALYDSRYQDAGWMLRWLGLGLIAMRHQVTEQLMFALDQPWRVTLNNALRALSLVIAVPIAYRMGGEGAAIAAVVASQFAGWPTALHFKYQQGLLGWRTEGTWVLGLALGLALGLGADAVLLTMT